MVLRYHNAILQISMFKSMFMPGGWIETGEWNDILRCYTYNDNWMLEMSKGYLGVIKFFRTIIRPTML